MRKALLVVGSVLAVLMYGLVLGATPARAQTAEAPFNTTSPNTNPLGVPDPNAPPVSPNDVAPVPPPTNLPAPAAPASGAGDAAAPGPVLAPVPVPPAAPTPAAAPVPAPGGINVNPAPPTPPPLKRAPDNNAAAMSGATIEDVPVQPLPPLDVDRGPTPPGMSRFGWAAFIGGGYEDFTNSNLRDLTGGGGAWDARLIGGTRSYVGFEAAYVGSARRIDALGLSGNSSLLSNGLEAALRLNIPVIRGSALYEPFAYAGLGWSRYSVTNYSAAITSDLASGDDVMTVPFGAGFAFGYKGFMADARAAYTPTYFNNLLQGVNGTGALNHWGVGGNVGFGF